MVKKLFCPLKGLFSCELQSKGEKHCKKTNLLFPMNQYTVVGQRNIPPSGEITLVNSSHLPLIFLGFVIWPC